MPVDTSVALRPQRLPRSVWTAAAIFAAVLAVLTIARHQFFLSQTFDMGFYVHGVWRIAHGEWTSSVFGFHVFADHFSPLMILLAPVAWVSTAVGLLLIQALAVGSIVVPAFRLGREHGGERLGWTCAIWMGLSATVWYTVLYDFRPATLGFAAIVWLVAELDTTRRPWVVGLLCVLAASSREDVAVLAGVAVLIHARLSRNARLGAVGAATAGVGVWYSIWGQQLFADFDYFLWYRYADYGDGPLAVLADLSYAIPTAVGRMGRSEVIVALAALTVPYLVVPVVVGWKRSWPAFLVIVANGVSADPFVPSLYFQYYVMSTVFLMWGAVHVYRQPTWTHRIDLARFASVAIFIVLGPVLAIGSAPVGSTVVGIASNWDRVAMSSELSDVPADSSVSAGYTVLPHLAERHEVFPFPGPMVCSPVILSHVDRTAHPELIVIESDNPGSFDPATGVFSGYTLQRSDGAIESWQLTGPVPPSSQCPSPDEAREGMLDRVREHASQG